MLDEKTARLAARITIVLAGLIVSVLSAYARIVTSGMIAACAIYLGFTCPLVSHLSNLAKSIGRIPMHVLTMHKTAMVTPLATNTDVVSSCAVASFMW